MLGVSGGSYVYAQLKSRVLSVSYDNVMTTKTDAVTMMMTGGNCVFAIFKLLSSKQRDALRHIFLYVVAGARLHWAVVDDIMSAYLFIGRLS